MARNIARSIRTAPLDVLRRLALSEPGDAKARDANEWYWVSRFGHPLVDNYNVKSLLQLESRYAKDLTKEEIDVLTPGDLPVLAMSDSPSARKIAAGHQATPTKLLESLAEDPDGDVRKAVGHNPATPSQVIAAMQSRNHSSNEVDGLRAKFLWTELETVPIDPELALEIASSPTYNSSYDEYRIALAHRKHLPTVVRLAQAKNRDSPEEVLVKLADDTDPAVRIAAGSNMALPEDVRRRLLNDKDRQVRHEVTINGHLSDETVLGLDDENEARQRLHNRLTSGVWVWGSNRASDSEQVLRELARSSHAGTRAAVAMSHGTPVDLLEQLANDEDDSVKSAVFKVLSFDTAQNYFVDSDELTFIWWYRREFASEELLGLARSRNAGLRAAIASRLDRADSLDTLAEDPDASVRAAAVGNPAIGFQELLRLADDPDEHVRRSSASVVANQLRRRQRPPVKTENWLELQDRLPSEVPQEFLSSGGGPDSRRLRFGEPWLQEMRWPSGDSLDLLSRVDNDAVRVSVASYSGSYASTNGDSSFSAAFDLHLSPDSLVLLLSDSVSKVRDAALANTGPSAIQVATRTTASAEALIGYARSAAVNVRRAVAGNASTPRPVLANLARDRDVSVRAAVAKNPATPADALGILAIDTSDEVLLELLSNANTPPEILEQQVDRISECGEHVRHRRLAGNPSSPAKVLSKVAYSRWADIRESVARNPKTPVDALEILAFDEDARVREVAMRRNQSD